MANHKSAEKRNRQNQKRRARNVALRSRVRNAEKTARAAIGTGAPEKAAATTTAIRELGRAASKGIIKKRTASRHTSRLMKAAARGPAPRAESTAGRAAKK